MPVTLSRAYAHTATFSSGIYRRLQRQATTENVWGLVKRLEGHLGTETIFIYQLTGSHSRWFPRRSISRNQCLKSSGRRSTNNCVGVLEVMHDVLRTVFDTHSHDYLLHHKLTRSVLAATIPYHFSTFSRLDILKELAPAMEVN